MINIKRVYDAPSEDDGFRVLVDRLWPRGISRERAELGLWLKEIAPTTELRQWFSHDPSKWPEFVVKYRCELQENSSVVNRLRELASNQMLTLLFAARDVEHNEAVVIRDWLTPNFE